MAALQIAFEAPDNSVTARAVPGKAIDLQHLSNQTMGDKALEIEVLQLFARQTRQLMKGLSEKEGSRSEIAHRLKGAALGVGAFLVADAAAALETDPEEPLHLSALSAAILDTELFILKLCR
ncbi:Hpt domain-containing protein [Pararhizobium arenae]|uniref:Hpt domain-containing protein n=1 Tax=Pararhizobium arenae TaxID=1856850 RepID=UPI00094AEDCB|nr:Hpt domain-containing protein [Pararhizobium arenae]